MSEVLEAFEFPGTGRRTSKYPWKDWMDGRIWKLKRGEDFDARSESMVTYLHRQAKQGGMIVRTSTSGDYLVFQFSKRPDSETQ